MDNFFSSPDVFDDLHTRDINCCGTVRQNHEGMLGSFCNKTGAWAVLAKGDRMTDSYSVSWKIWKWTKIYFFTS
jgi:hypothetical protein